MEIYEVMKVCAALNSKTRLRLVLALREQPMSTKEVMEEYSEQYDSELRRESIYRALEKLRDADLLYREYDEDANSFKYFLADKQVSIDFGELDTNQP